MKKFALIVGLVLTIASAATAGIASASPSMTIDMNNLVCNKPDASGHTGVYSKAKLLYYARGGKDPCGRVVAPIWAAMGITLQVAKGMKFGTTCVGNGRGDWISSGHQHNPNNPSADTLRHAGGSSFYTRVLSIFGPSCYNAWMGWTEDGHQVAVLESCGNAECKAFPPTKSTKTTACSCNRNKKVTPNKGGPGPCASGMARNNAGKCVKITTSKAPGPCASGMARNNSGICVKVTTIASCGGKGGQTITINGNGNAVAFVCPITVSPNICSNGSDCGGCQNNSCDNSTTPPSVPCSCSTAPSCSSPNTIVNGVCTAPPVVITYSANCNAVITGEKSNRTVSFSATGTASDGSSPASYTWVFQKNGTTVATQTSSSGTFQLPDNNTQYTYQLTIVWPGDSQYTPRHASCSNSITTGGQQLGIVGG